jgi:hypothetical protein
MSLLGALSRLRAGAPVGDSGRDRRGRVFGGRRVANGEIVAHPAGLVARVGATPPGDQRRAAATR